MTRASIVAGIRVAVSFCVLVLAALAVAGCATGTPGETSDEVARRHKEIIWNDTKQIQSDLDAYFMLDKPSKLSDKIIR